MEHCITTPTLEDENMTNTQEQHNEEHSSLFYEKTQHLKDNDFVEIDREILQMMGFKHIFCKKKDEKSNTKMDEMEILL